MKPGQYLALRRGAACLDQETAQSDFDVIAARMGLRGRVRSVEAIEADDGDLTMVEVTVLAGIFDFDANLLLTIIRNPAVTDGIICRKCGCSWEDPCDPPCGWAEGGCTSDKTALCTACVDGGE